MQDREKAEICDAQDEQGEEGEEEEPRETDPLVDFNDVKSEHSRTARLPAPHIAFGSLGKSGPDPKKKDKKRKAAALEKDKAGEDNDTDLIDLEAEESKPTLADPMIMAVPRLKMLVEMLNACPPCFLGLVPDLILRAKQKPGKQLRGVRGFESFCDVK